MRHSGAAIQEQAPWCSPPPCRPHLHDCHHTSTIGTSHRSQRRALRQSSPLSVANRVRRAWTVRRWIWWRRGCHRAWPWAERQAMAVPVASRSWPFPRSGQCSALQGALQCRACLRPSERTDEAVHPHHRHRQGQGQDRYGQPGLQHAPPHLAQREARARMMAEMPEIRGKQPNTAQNNPELQE